MSVIISGQHLPNKHLRIALTSIYGIGLSTSDKICQSLSIDPTTKVYDLTDEQEEKVRKAVGEYKTGGDLRNIVVTNIKLKKDSGSYQGRRHRYGLPVNGQRTKTNARTAKRRTSKRKPTDGR